MLLKKKKERKRKESRCSELRFAEENNFVPVPIPLEQITESVDSSIKSEIENRSSTTLPVPIVGYKIITYTIICNPETKIRITVMIRIPKIQIFDVRLIRIFLVTILPRGNFKQTTRIIDRQLRAGPS